MTLYYFVVNPAAAAGACLKRFAGAQEELDRRGIDYVAVYSERPGHATELTNLALRGGADCIVAVGGDGTVREVAEAMRGSDVPLGILPYGTGNDVIKALDISSDPVESLRQLLAGKPRSIDAITANGMLFLNVAGLGFDVDVLEKTRYYKDHLQTRGTFAYILGILHALIRPSSYRVKVCAAEQKLDMETFILSVGNGTHIGGGMMVTPLADMADGLMDVCVVRKVSRLKVLSCLAKFIRGEHIHLDVTTYFKTDKLRVESSPEAKVQLDGEIIGSTPVIFQIHPGAITVIG